MDQISKSVPVSLVFCSVIVCLLQTKHLRQYQMSFLAILVIGFHTPQFVTPSCFINPSKFFPTDTWFMQTFIGFSSLMQTFWNGVRIIVTNLNCFIYIDVSQLVIMKMKKALNCKVNGRGHHFLFFGKWNFLTR